MKATYYLPILTVLLIFIFYLGLPALHLCPLPKRLDDQRRGWRSHWFILALTAVYTVVALVNLGNVRAPKTFRSFDGDSAVLELETPSPVGGICFYTGIIPGSYTLEYSADGQSWIPAASYEQGFSTLIKWEDLKLDDAPDFIVRAIRITGYSGAELGEVAVCSPEGELLRLRSDVPALCDEHKLVPDTPYFLNSSYFDEIYHARTAWEYLRGIRPYEWTHPPLGKIFISLGIALFGMTPFGWRIVGTLFGAAMIPLVYWFARRLFGGRALPACCAVLTATDFMHFAQTRIATIDTYGVFFILLMYGCMYGYLQTHSRRDLALSGLFFGLGAACKWTCLYAGAGLGVLWAADWNRRFREVWVPQGGKHRSRGSGLRDTAAAFAKNVGFCLIFFVAVPVLIYYLSYLPWGLADGSVPFSKKYTEMVWYNQQSMFSYHKGVTADHPYASKWYQWLVDIRPVFFYLKYFGDGRRSSFGTWLNPVLCWAGLLSVFLLIYMAAFRRDRKAAFLLLAYLAQLLPWVFITRPVFEYHYFPCSVFLALSLGYVFSLMRESSPRGWKPWAFGLCGLSAALFVLFYPAISGLPVDDAAATRVLKWLPTWPF